jgi:hypothetical protein
MAKINLYPNANKRWLYLHKTIGFLKKANFFSVVIFLAFTIVIFSIVLINKSEIEKASSDKEAYRNKLKDRSEIEMKYVFMRDRISKFKEITKDKSIISRIEDLVNILKKNGDVTFREVELNKEGLSITVATSDYEKLKSVIAEFRPLDYYSKGLISFINFNPDSGYTLRLQLQSK